MGQQGKSNIVTFQNRTEKEVAFYLASAIDDTLTPYFSIQPGGYYYYPVPGRDARTHERLRLVEDDITTSVNITTEELRQLGGWTLVVTKTGDNFNDLVHEDTRKKPWQFILAPIRLFFHHSSQHDQLPR